MFSEQMQDAAGERRREMGREIQRIGLGFLATPEVRPRRRLSARRWLGTQLERFGKRLQDRTSPVSTLATARSETS